MTAAIPLRALQLIAAVLAKMLYVFPTRIKKTTLVNLSLCYKEKSNVEIEQLAQRSIHHTSCIALEMGKAWLLPIDKVVAMVKEVEGEEILIKALQQKQGVILLAPHLGNWEVFGQYVCSGNEATFLYQPPKMQRLDPLMKAVRSRGGVKLAPTNARGVALLLKALLRGEMVGVLPDQEPKTEGGVYAPFFGVNALSMVLVSKLLARTKATVVCGFAQRLPGGKGYKVVYKQADSLIYAKQLEQSVAGLNKSVENCVSHASEQYQWEYKRFKRRPCDADKVY